jgi:hypothetical protein
MALAATMSLGGTAPNTRGFSPPAPDGQEGWFHFVSTDPAIARKNLIKPAQPGVFTDPAPVLAGGYASFPGTLRFLESLIAEAASMSVLVAVRFPELTGNARILSNAGGAAGGQFSLYVTNTGALKVAAVYSDSGSANTAGGLTGLIAGKWYLLGMALEDGVGRRLYNYTDNVPANVFAKATPRVVVPGAAMRIGTSGNASPSSPAPLDIHAISIASRVVGLDELDANAAAMRARAAAAGITV